MAVTLTSPPTVAPKTSQNHGRENNNAKDTVKGAERTRTDDDDDVVAKKEMKENWVEKTKKIEKKK